MRDEQLEARLLNFIRERFLDGDPGAELDADSPLLEWGVLNSMNTVILLMYIRDEIGVQIPPSHINSQNLGAVRSIAHMIVEFSTAADNASQ